MVEDRDDSHGSRITALEVSVRSISTSISELKEDVDGKFDALFKNMQNIRGDFAAASKTQWPTFIAATAVILVIVGMVGNGYVRDMERVEEGLDKLQVKFNGHEAATGIHWSLRERVLNHEEGLSKIDKSIRNIQVWQEKHSERAGQSHTASLEKIKALERKVFDGQ